jgi:pantothenate kinase-related protein Tda10
MPRLEPLQIIVRGPHDAGKTTVASLIKMFLEENGFRKVTLSDVPPLPSDAKADFMSRFMRNRDLRPVNITVELVEQISK